MGGEGLLLGEDGEGRLFVRAERGETLGAEDGGRVETWAG